MREIGWIFVLQENVSCMAWRVHQHFEECGWIEGLFGMYGIAVGSLAGGVVLDQFQSHSEASMEERSVAELSHGCEKARNRQRTGVDAPAIKGGEQGPAGASARANCRAGHDSG